MDAEEDVFGTWAVDDAVAISLEHDQFLVGCAHSLEDVVGAQHVKNGVVGSLGDQRRGCDILEPFGHDVHGFDHFGHAVQGQVFFLVLFLGGRTW